MIPTSVPGSGGDPIHVAGGMTAWHTVISLLKNQRYEEVVDLLQDQMQTAVHSRHHNQATFLRMATELGAACLQQQSDIESYRQSLTQAMLREQELNRQLIKLFELLIQSEPFVTQPPLGHPAGFRPQSMPFAKRLLETGQNGTQAGASTVPGPTAKPGGEDGHDINMLTVTCLGSFRVYFNGRLIENWSGNKSKSVFKHMVVHRERPATHDILMDLFWQGDVPEAARRNLYQAIYVIRQALQGAVEDLPTIVCRDGAYSINPQITVWVDSTVFEQHYQNGRQLQRQGEIADAIREFELADSLYEGDFLPEDMYEEWTLVHRERLKHAYLDMLDRLSQYHWTTQQYQPAITYGLKILQGDSCREDVHRRLMLAYLHQGRRHLALKQYYRCVQALSEELGVAPMPETEQLFQRIMHGNDKSNDK